MNLAFFRSHKEEMFLEFIEIKAHSACQPIEEGLFFVLNQILILVYYQLELNYLFCLKFVLH